mmetsp:Transcript_26889/g.72506  ORF Transcript_26889/g.72506 Transcript_26889/m.72506 type:complete len:336 (-) Transcript_26889:301-1308(-)
MLGGEIDRRRNNGSRFMDWLRVFVFVLAAYVVYSSIQGMHRALEAHGKAISSLSDQSTQSDLASQLKDVVAGLGRMEKAVQQHPAAMSTLATAVADGDKDVVQTLQALQKSVDALGTTLKETASGLNAVSTETKGEVDAAFKEVKDELLAQRSILQDLRNAASSGAQAATPASAPALHPKGGGEADATGAEAAAGAGAGQNNAPGSEADEAKVRAAAELRQGVPGEDVASAAAGDAGANKAIAGAEVVASTAGTGKGEEEPIEEMDLEAAEAAHAAAAAHHGDASDEDDARAAGGAGAGSADGGAAAGGTEVPTAASTASGGGHRPEADAHGGET